MTHADLDALKAANPVETVAAQWVKLRRAGRAMIGPCPICGGSSRNGRFEVRPDDGSWVCAVCQDGGDVIALVQKVENVDFRTAVDRLGGTLLESEESRTRRERLQAERRERQQREGERYRESERRRCHKAWLAGIPICQTPVQAYLAGRALEAPMGAHLRASLDLPFWTPGDDGKSVEVHRGPAMLAAITGPDGRFAALHMTWIDPTQPGRKVMLADPKTGEVLPAKKVRGSKKGGRIELVRHSAPRRLFIGEGIETVLSVWVALRDTASPLLQDAAFWSSVDLGNLGGPAAGTIAHPIAVGPKGRPQRVPGPEPSFNEPAIELPESVQEVRILADGDSDPFLTRTTLLRAAKRWARPGRRIRAAWPPAGLDFNDLLLGKSA